MGPPPALFPMSLLNPIVTSAGVDQSTYFKLTLTISTQDSSSRLNAVPNSVRILNWFFTLQLLQLSKANKQKPEKQTKKPNLVQLQ